MKRKATPLDLPIVEVTWYDHTSGRGWQGGKAPAWQEKDNWVYAPLDECRDVGRLVCRTKTSLVLASMVCADGDIGGIMKIPYGWVHKIRRLRVTRRGVPTGQIAVDK